MGFIDTLSDWALPDFIFGKDADISSVLFGKPPEKSTYKPEMYEYDPSAFETSYGGRELEHQMRRRMMGQAPSVAEQQLQMGLGRNIAAAQAQQASSAGVSPGLAARLAGQQRTGAMMGTNMQASMLRAREQAQAEQAYAQWLNQQQQARMALEQMRGGQNIAYNQMLMNQSMANVAGTGQQGLAGPIMSMLGAGMAGGLGGGSPGYGGGTSAANTMNPYGGYGPPQYGAGGWYA